MKHKRLVAFLVVLALLTVGAKLMADVTMGDDEWIGLASDAGRIVFDDQTVDGVSVMDAEFGVGTTSPAYDVDIYNASGNADLRLQSAGGAAYLQVESTASDAGMIMDAAADTGDARLYWREDGTNKWGLLYYSPNDYLRLYNYNQSNTAAYFHDGGNINLAPNEGFVGIGSTATPIYDLDVSGDLRATGEVIAEDTVSSGPDAQDILAQTAMWYSASTDGKGGFYVYAEDDVSQITNLTSPTDTDTGVVEMAWVRWLVHDQDVNMNFSGEATLEYTGGLGCVEMSDDGSRNVLLYCVGRGQAPNAEGYQFLTFMGSHTYDVNLMVMWQ